MKYAFLILLIPLLLASCFPTSPEGDNRDPLQGTEGVRISLLNPPGVVYENEEFPVMIHLQNMGAYNVSVENPGSFYVSVDPLYLSRGDFVTRFHQIFASFIKNLLAQKGGSCYTSQEPRLRMLFCAGPVTGEQVWHLRFSAA